MPGLAVLAFLFVVVVIVAAIALTTGALPALRRRDDAVKEEAAVRDAAPGADTLRYRVPEGQDPAAVMAALEAAGYHATPAPELNTHDLLVPCPHGADPAQQRAHVRAVIAGAALNLEGDSERSPVVFEDERR